MAQVHAALAYYWSHQEEIHQDIENEEALVAGLKAKRVEGDVPGAGGVLDDRHVVARAADQRGDGATKGFELVPWKEFRRFSRKALGPPRGPL